MSNQDWNHLGNEIKDIVQNAIESQDFKQLNQSIRGTIDSALDNVNKSLRGVGDTLEHNKTQGWQPNWQKQSAAYQSGSYRMRPSEPKPTGIFARTTSSKGAGYALAITGGIFAGGLGIATFILLVILAFGGEVMIPIAILLPLLLGSGWMAWKGGKILGRIRRFKKYIRTLGSRTYCSIKELADSAGKSQNFVIKDLRDMIRRDMFLEGHLDQNGTCLMVTNETYQLYQNAQKQLEIKKQKQFTAPKEPEKLSPEVRNVIKEGNEYLRKIKESNDAIPGIEISEKISRLEIIIQKIFHRVEQHPELIPDLRKFMEYYLPTTLKLLNAYEVLDGQPVQGENIKSAKKEIEETMDTISLAFENLLDSFFKDTAWDISTDISVLQTMLAQEGLTKKDF